jgi:protein TonB
MTPASRTASIAVTVALHAAALAGLLQLDAVRKPLLEAVPLMINFITPPEPERPPPEVRLPKPPPPAPQPRPLEPPLLAAESAVQSPMAVAPQPQPRPEPAVIAPPPPPRVVPPSFVAAYLRNPPPAYPPMSRRRGEQGTVILRVLVNAEGGAEKVAVRTSSGHELLDQAAHDAVHHWRFVPARQGDEPVAASVLVPITFALEK